MPNSKDKIAAGLADRDNPKSAGLSALQGAPTTIQEVTKLSRKALSARARLRSFTAAVEQLTEEHRQTAESRYANMDLPQKDIANVVRKDVADFRKRAVQAARGDIDGALGEIRQINEQFAAIKDSWSDPAAVLMRQTRASDRRSTLAANLSNAGPKELENAARDAAASGDADLAAAVLSRLDSMRANDRKAVQFDRAELARAVAGDEFNEAVAAIGLADLAMDEAALADDEAQGRRVAGSRKNAIGLKRRELQELGVQFDEDGEPQPPGARDDDPTLDPHERLQRQMDRNTPGTVAGKDKRRAVLDKMAKAESADAA